MKSEKTLLKCVSFFLITLCAGILKARVLVFLSPGIWPATPDRALIRRRPLRAHHQRSRNRRVSALYRKPRATSSLPRLALSDPTRNRDQHIKGFLTLKGSTVGEPLQGSTLFLDFVPKVLASSNLGLELANAFGVLQLNERPHAAPV